MPRRPEGFSLPDEPVVLGTALRHGLAEGDILPAYRDVIRVLEEDDLTLLIGPGRDGSLLESGVVGTAEGNAVVHAVPVHRKYVR